LALIFAVATVNFVDRQVLVILLDDIGRDLRLTDTQLGLLTGVAFALFFAVAGLPIARLSSAVPRRFVIGACVALWSLFTAACGAAQSFLQLFALRTLVAIGEAGSAPASQSLVSDYFPHAKRATALAVVALGAPVGVLCGLAIGGWLNVVVGWRMTFVLL